MKNFNEKYCKLEFIRQNKYVSTYKAVNSITRDNVVLKLFNEEINPTQLEENINILKDMENPNLIQINSLGSFEKDEKTYYYVEEKYFLSKSLNKRLQSKEISTKEASEIVKQIAEGLKEFHFKNLTFENLNCDNIYINNNGQVKIDTLSYLYKEKENLSQEDDIYSLGGILFQLATNECDFKVEKSKYYITDKDLLTIINKCTNEKYNKYEDLNQLIADLNDYIESSREIINSNGAEDYEGEIYVASNPYKPAPLKVIKNLCACMLVFAMMATVFGGTSLLNLYKDTASNKKIQTTTSTAPVAKETNTKEETTQEDTQSQPKTEPVETQVSSQEKNDNNDNSQEEDTDDSQDKNTDDNKEQDSNYDDDYNYNYRNDYTTPTANNESYNYSTNDNSKEKENLNTNSVEGKISNNNDQEDSEQSPTNENEQLDENQQNNNDIQIQNNEEIQLQSQQ